MGRARAHAVCCYLFRLEVPMIEVGGGGAGPGVEVGVVAGACAGPGVRTG